jgi:hypothetical protein
MYPFLGALNIRYVTSFNKLPEGDITLLKYLPEYPLWFYRVNKTLPRAYIAHDAVIEKDAKKTLEHMTSSDFDARDSVILEEAPGLPLVVSSNATAEIRRYEDQAVDIDAALDAPGVLVLADSFYPGWRAYVDGKEEKIVRANLFFRAVSLSAGKHRVEFRYQPVSLTIGAAISLATLCGLLVWSAIALFAGRSKKYVKEFPEVVPVGTAARTFFQPMDDSQPGEGWGHTSTAGISPADHRRETR